MFFCFCLYFNFYCHALEPEQCLTHGGKSIYVFMVRNERINGQALLVGVDLLSGPPPAAGATAPLERDLRQSRGAALTARTRVAHASSPRERVGPGRGAGPPARLPGTQQCCGPQGASGPPWGALWKRAGRSETVRPGGKWGLPPKTSPGKPRAAVLCEQRQSVLRQ